MNKQKKKQIEIAKKIVEQGNCKCIACYSEESGLFPGVRCPLGESCPTGDDEIVEKAKELIRSNSETSKKDLLKRVEKLEKKVDGLDSPSCDNTADAIELMKGLEKDILSLVTEYEEKTGLKVNEIDLKTGPFIFLDIFKRDGEEQRNEVVRKNHIVKVKVTL